MVALAPSGEKVARGRQKTLTVMTYVYMSWPLPRAFAALPLLSVPVKVREATLALAKFGLRGRWGSRHEVHSENNTICCCCLLLFHRLVKERLVKLWVADLIQSWGQSESRRKESISLEFECWEKEDVFDPGLIFFLIACLLSQGLEAEFTHVWI